MAGEVVFITGGNGHVGYKVIVLALQAGYKVRAAVRTQEKANTILSAPSLKALKAGDNLSFVIVPDLLAEGAYDEAIKGAEYAIHIASPITSGLTDPEDFKPKLIEPAVKGTLAILTAAQKTPTIKRVVITSSVVAQVAWHDFFEAETGIVINEKSRVPNPAGPYSGEFEAYAASKIFALNAAEEWRAHNKHDFSVVHVHPSFVLGKDELVADKEDFFRGTNRMALAQVLGQSLPYKSPRATILLDDTALAHVKALDTHKIPDGQSIVTSSVGPEGAVWDDANDIAKQLFPKAVESGFLPANGTIPGKVILVDSTKSQELLGYQYKGYKDQVNSVIGHYLELNGVAAA